MITVLSLLALYMSQTSSSPLPIWTSAEHHPPCYESDKDKPMVAETLKQFLERASGFTNVLKHRIESYIQTMKADYCIDVSDEEIQTASFLDYNSTTPVFYNVAHYNICFNSYAFLNVMGNTYETLNKLAGYFQQLRETSIDEVSLRRMILTQGDIYKIMCSIKISTRWKGQTFEVIVPEVNLSDTFIQYRQGSISTCIQQSSEYVTMLDFKKVFTHLDALLNSLLSENIKC